MDDLLPVLITRLASQEELVAVMRAALSESVLELTLEEDPSTLDLHVLEAWAPGYATPLLVRAEPRGRPTERGWPLGLMPLNEEQADKLAELLGAGSLPRMASPPAQPAGSPSPPAVSPAPAPVALAPSIPPISGIVATLSSLPPAPDPADPLVARILGGKYQVTSLLGTGGMGRVYKGRHVQLERSVAIKVLDEAFRNDPRYAKHFHTEALAASRLDHPNVCRVFDFGEEPDGLLYIAMELLAGRELHDVLNDEGPLPLERIVDLGAQLCAALAAAHERGLVHRDVKADNVVLLRGIDDDGHETTFVKVCDFGLAMSAAHDGRPLLGFGGVCGTPEYMSPEHVRGERLDARADVYACGVLLYRMATGTLPFLDDDPREVLRRQVEEPPPPPSTVRRGLDPRLEAVILRAMSKDKERRYQSARELRSDLRALRAQAIPAAPPSSPGALAMPPPAPSTPGFVMVPSGALAAMGGRSSVSAMAAVRAAAPPVIESFEIEPQSSPRSIRVGSRHAPPLAARASSFAEFFVAFATATGSVTRDAARTSEPPDRARGRLGRSAQAMLENRGDVVLVRPGTPGAVDLEVLTAAGEHLPLRQLLAPSLHAVHGPAMAQTLARHGLFAVVLKEGLGADEATTLADVLSQPAFDPGWVAAQFPHVLLLGESERPSRTRPLQPVAEVALARLARELPAIAGLGNAYSTSRARIQLVTDIIRPVDATDAAQSVLDGTDALVASFAAIPELSGLDLAELVAAALPHGTCVAVATLFVADEGGGGSRAPTPRNVPAARLRAARGVALRLGRERTTEGDDVLRKMLRVGLVELAALPDELQRALFAEQRAVALAKDPEPLLATLDPMTDEARYVAELELLGPALRMLAQHGRVRSLGRVVGALNEQARCARWRAPAVARTLAHLADPELLLKIAVGALVAAADVQEAARAVLVAAGDAGAVALCRARAQTPNLDFGTRRRFVAMLAEMGPGAALGIAQTLGEITDPLALEDILRGVPDAQGSEVACDILARFLRHGAPAVRRAALGAFAACAGPRGRLALYGALDDGDAAVRLAAIVALGRVGITEPSVVQRIERLFNDGGEEVLVTAATALGRCTGDAHDAAAAALRRLLSPRTGMRAMLSRDADAADAPAVVEALAKSLLAIGGADGRRTVEERAGRSDGDVRRRLARLLT